MGRNCVMCGRNAIVVSLLCLALGLSCAEETFIGTGAIAQARNEELAESSGLLTKSDDLLAFMKLVTRSKAQVISGTRTGSKPTTNANKLTAGEPVKKGDAQANTQLKLMDLGTKTRSKATSTSGGSSSLQGKAESASSGKEGFVSDCKAGGIGNLFVNNPYAQRMCPTLSKVQCIANGFCTYHICKAGGIGNLFTSNPYAQSYCPQQTDAVWCIANGFCTYFGGNTVTLALNDMPNVGPCPRDLFFQIYPEYRDTVMTCSCDPTLQANEIHRWLVAGRLDTNSRVYLVSLLLGCASQKCALTQDLQQKPAASALVQNTSVDGVVELLGSVERAGDASTNSWACG